VPQARQRERPATTSSPSGMRTARTLKKLQMKGLAAMGMIQS